MSINHYLKITIAETMIFMLLMIPFFQMGHRTPFLYPVIPGEKSWQVFKGEIYVSDNSTKYAKSYRIQYNYAGQSRYSKCNADLNHNFCSFFERQKKAVMAEFKYVDIPDIGRVIVESKKPVVKYYDVARQAEGLNFDNKVGYELMNKVTNTIYGICLFYIFLKLTINWLDQRKRKLKN